MRGRWQWWAVFALVLCLGAIPLWLTGVGEVLLGLARGETFIGGKPLSQWERLLRDRDPGERREAALRLGQAGASAKAAVPALLGTLEDEDEYTRVNAARSLGEIVPDTAEAAAALVRALRQDKQGGVRRLTAEALGRMGPAAAAAAPALGRALAEDEDSYVRQAAAEALGHLGQAGRTELSVLRKAAEQDSDWNVRTAAGEALKRLSDVQ